MDEITAHAPMDIFEATRSYESWMARHHELVPHQLIDKHTSMKENLFAFFRGTFYRWMQIWPSTVSKPVQKAPHILAVADLHIDSFGTWRDIEGRLAWGVDDFDEASYLPYTNDLVRLASSVRIVSATGVLQISLRQACDTILEAYRDTLRSGGAPIILAENEHILETLGIKELKGPLNFWKKLNRLPHCQRDCPGQALKALEHSLPRSVPYKLVRRAAGIGSLGRPRFVAIAEWKGGFIAREAKAMIPPAAAWNHDNARTNNYYNRIIKSAVRSHDPFQQVIGGWLIRRLSPDSDPISISDWPRKRDEITLLRSMSREVANIHLGSTSQVKSILSHLESIDSEWLHEDARQMAKAVTKDWKEYRH
jgi:hypothetical protein